MEKQIQIVGGHPKAGVGIMIFKDGKVLLGKRKGSHGAGEYSFPGGHLEYGESFLSCIVREIAEEAGIKVKNIRFQYLANIIRYMPKHYVHIGLTAEWESGEPQVLEPNKCEGWGWYDLDELPEPIFYMCKLAFRAFDGGETYFDIHDQE